MQRTLSSSTGCNVLPLPAERLSTWLPTTRTTRTTESPALASEVVEEDAVDVVGVEDEAAEDVVEVVVVVVVVVDEAARAEDGIEITTAQTPTFLPPSRRIERK